MAESDLTQEYIRSLFDYDPSTGTLTWRERPKEHFQSTRLWRRHLTRWRGKEAGYIDKSNGYRRVDIDGVGYRAHRVAWLHYHGELPASFIDHANGVRNDNRISNLRCVNRSQSNMNRSMWSKKKIKAKGVYFDRGKFLVSITANRQVHRIGWFDTIEEASEAYQKAASALHGEYARF